MTVEEYRVAVFEREAPLRGGEGVRLTRIEVKPSAVDDVIEAFGDSAVPLLAEHPGFRSALLFADPALRATGQRDRVARPSGAGGKPERRRGDPGRCPGGQLTARSAALRTTAWCSVPRGAPDRLFLVVADREDHARASSPGAVGDPAPDPAGAPPVRAENLCHLGRCSAVGGRSGHANGAWQGGSDSGWRAMIFGWWA